MAAKEAMDIDLQSSRDVHVCVLDGNGRPVEEDPDTPW